MFSELKFRKSDFEKRNYALFGLMCVYGIELLDDNIAECHKNMLEILADYIGLDEQDDLYQAAAYVLSQNIVHGDALTMLTISRKPIIFAEWGYLGKGKFQRRDFRFDTLTQMSSFGFVVVAGSLARTETVPFVHAYLKELREVLLADGVVEQTPEGLRFRRDQLFNSPSTAAGVVLGRAANGRNGIPRTQSGGR